MRAAAAYPNGEIPTSQLVLVAVSTLGLGDQYLVAGAAASYRAMNTAFKKALGTPLTMAEAYRSRARQQYLYDGYIAGEPGFNEAALPGTSVHGLGLAVDFSGGVDSYGTSAKTWMNANGPKFGWQPKGDGFKKKEPWHFEYDGSYTPGDSDQTNTGEDDLFKIIEAAETDNIFIVGPAGRATISSPSHVSLLRRFQKQDSLLTVEVDICISYIRKVY
ncbi:M15 family metallopeptidase [Curtobacterium aetherium]|uniref:M15 family metallopeptidase n=1 Tax=Curtobacterium aetherium TaxID=2841594 RepID=UPI00209AECE8|nr:M15 family metallopeptidase [Curtobacterium sp. L6-1]